MDPVDPKRRGRRLFGGRRRHEPAEDQMNEPTTTVPDAPAPPPSAEPGTTLSGSSPESGQADASVATMPDRNAGEAVGDRTPEPVGEDPDGGIEVIPDPAQPD